jgi:hypothetical protein
MTVLMRQAGLVIPGMYGPAKEEWLAMGREALKRRKRNGEIILRLSISSAPFECGYHWR